MWNQATSNIEQHENWRGCRKVHVTITQNHLSKLKSMPKSFYNFQCLVTNKLSDPENTLASVYIYTWTKIQNIRQFK